MRILVVEDETPKLRHVVEYLRSTVADLDLATARSVRSALDALEDSPPDLLILDMSLPTFDIGGDEGGGRPQGFGGQELMRMMMLEERRTPVIVLTGYDAFNKAGGQIGLDALNHELASEHPENFLGMLHFNSAFGDWKAKLRDLLDKFGGETEMKILLVDDDPRRYRRLIERMAEVGVSRDEVVLVTSANDARDSLEEQQFDLMVVDIILPLRPETEPEERHSMELLSELIEYGSLKRPRQIVGLSASDTAAMAATPFFSDRLWTVIRYSESNDDWIGQIQNCVTYLHAGASTRHPSDQKADLVVICALADPELNAVLALQWGWKPARPIDDVTFVHEGAITLGDRTYSVLASSAPRIGMVQSALLSCKLIDLYKPAVISMTGICAGIPGKAEIGDVLLADPTWDWQSGKRTRVADRSKFAVAPHQLDVDISIRSRFEQLRADREAFALIAAGWKGAASIPKLVIGPVASGSAVLADGTIAAGIREQHRELCGIEMEASGLYAAAAMASGPRPLAFSIKAVCDFADPSRQTTFRLTHLM